MTLKETIDLMKSSNYKDRFKAEYYQTKNRYEHLVDILNKDLKKELKFKLACPRDLLKTQAEAMRNYLMALQDRALIEGIELTE